MIIVSQDKTQIINFNNTQTLGIESGSDTVIVIEDLFKIGEYTTEERAKEVLQEIIQKIEDTSLTNLMENLQISIHNPNFGGSLSSVYYMPEE